jgi:CelD/BcsL family acetyltransferase involved in cellulose biosynthesis
MQLASDPLNERCGGGVVSQMGHAISICNDALEFERIRPEWNALRQPGQDQDPFLSCDWFATWWRAFGGRRALYLVTARRNGRLCAVLPLMLERAWRHGIPVRRLAAIGNDHTPRFDLVRADDDEQLHRDIWSHVMTLRNRWDVFDLPRLSAHSTTADRFVRLAEEQGMQYSLWQHAPESPWIDILPDWDDYLESLSANFRKDLRRKMRRLTAAGTVGLETVTGRQALDQALADGLTIEAEGWKGSNRTAISSQPEVADFYTELAGVMADRGQLRLHFLTLNDVRIAFDYSIIANRTLYSLKAGHSTDYARFSPGTVMLGLILQRAHEEGLIGMDLLGDADQFKMHWTDAVLKHRWLHCYSDSLRGRLSHLIKCRLLPLMSRRQPGHGG